MRFDSAYAFAGDDFSECGRRRSIAAVHGHVCLFDATQIVLIGSPARRGDTLFIMLATSWISHLSVAIGWTCEE